MAINDTDTTICNSALIKIGANTILSLDDNTKEAKLCKRQYPILRDDLLRSHPWNFAVKRVELATTVNTPAFGFDNEFALPTDVLRVLDINDNDLGDVDFKLENGKLLSNSDEIKIKYIARITDTSLFDSNFVETLAFRIAAELAYPLMQSVSLSQNLYTLYNNSLSRTRLYDAQEGKPDELEADEWITSRL